MKAKTLLICFLAFLNSPLVYGQNKADSSWKHAHKNVVRYNLSSALLFGPGSCVIFGYERVLKPYQSISVNAGTIALPDVISITTDSFVINRNTKRNGFNASIDYRFYLQKENKYKAPRGVYIGPYYSFNQFQSTTTWTRRNASQGDEVVTDTKFQIHTFGGEVGYQFLFWKRVTLDIVVVGPGISTYRLQSKITGSVNSEGREELHNATLDLIAQKYPGLKTLLEEKELDTEGTLSTWSLGYRYLIHIGFNF